MEKTAFSSIFPQSVVDSHHRSERLLQQLATEKRNDLFFYLQFSIAYEWTANPDQSPFRACSVPISDYMASQFRDMDFFSCFSGLAALPFMTLTIPEPGSSGELTNPEELRHNSLDCEEPFPETSTLRDIETSMKWLQLISREALALFTAVKILEKYRNGIKGLKRKSLKHERK